MSQDQDGLDRNPQALALTAFVSKKKFVPEALYPGATNDGVRVHCQAVIDALAQRLMPLAGTSIDDELFKNELRQTILKFGATDSEELERGAGYVEEMMDILGIESSGGLLNMWAYGFDPSEFLSSVNAKPV